ncbi:MAG TPA: Holliday junction resolvase RuvX [Oscillospiraceae bacterium]|nr:Holliday junction resolvase RuvX [Oscillospiraceae bacterium]HNW05107.1 Holliday junction resolvase RuvX [Oscillospiraceae bacterium]
MRILSVDFGDARTGLAVCDPAELLASPAGVIHERHIERALEKAASAAKESGAQKIVVGLPLNMNGSEGPRAELCRDFAGRLAALSGIETVLWDERRTTVTAASYLNDTDTRGKKRKAVIDEVAAVVILESYLAWRRNHPDEP